MKKWILLTLSMSLLLLNSYSQNAKPNLELSNLIDSVIRSFRNCDTERSIILLEKIEKNYPTDAILQYTNKSLADIYIAEGKFTDAKRKLLYAFQYTPTTYFVDAAVYNKIFKTSYGRAKADMCVSINRVYLAEKNFDSSLYFLNLACGKYLPYKECGNGIMMYLSFLSPYFADYYLAVGDTVKAINRLLDFCTQPDGDELAVTKKLKSILLFKWTQKEITKQVDEALKSLSFTKTPYYEFTCEINLFGHIVEGISSDNKNRLKDYYLNHPSLKLLRTEQTDEVLATQQEMP